MEELTIDLRTRVGIGLIGIGIILFFWSSPAILGHGGLGAFALMATALFLVGLYLVVVTPREPKIIYMGHQPEPPQQP